MPVELEQNSVDLMAILEQSDSDMPDDDDLDIDFTSPLAAVASVPVAALAPKDSEEGSGLASDDPSEGLSWEEHFNGVKSAFFKAKPIEDVKTFASLMPFRDWLDYAIKLMPKQLDVRSVQITTVQVELPPGLGFSDGEVIDVELPI
jgi:hypothetical protein